MIKGFFTPINADNKILADKKMWDLLNFSFKINICQALSPEIIMRLIKNLKIDILIDWLIQMNLHAIRDYVWLVLLLSWLHIRAHNCNLEYCTEIIGKPGTVILQTHLKSWVIAKIPVFDVIILAHLVSLCPSLSFCLAVSYHMCVSFWLSVYLPV